jgi:hypothetical protein
LAEDERMMSRRCADERKMTLQTKLAALLLALAAGCTTAPSPDRGPAPSPFPSQTPAPSPAPSPFPSQTPAPSPFPSQPPAPEPSAKPQQSETIAVAGLMQSARADAAAGRLANAAASIERALRIEPRNPRLWQELARVRMQQKEYVQAESMAARSSSWAASDNTLRADNWRLIAQAREARGDSAGARAALDSARRLGR